MKKKGYMHKPSERIVHFVNPPPPKKKLVYVRNMCLVFKYRRVDYKYM